MTEYTPPSQKRPEGAGLPAHLLSLLASVAAYLKARLELAGLEGKDAAGYGLKAILYLVAALGLVAFGYAFLWIGLIALIASLLPTHWGWIVLAMGVLHAGVAAICVAAAAAQWKKPFFGGTLEEFRKDQEWLNQQK
jgi:uncharacterized membrane protein YqjE